MIDTSMILTEAVKAASLGVLSVVCGVLAKYGPKLATEAWKVIETKAKEKNLEYVLKTAKTIFYQVEEDYRIGDKLSQEAINKADYFDGLLMSKFPSISKDDLRNIRQSVAGAYNEGKSRESEDKFNSVSKVMSEDGWLGKEEAVNLQLRNEELSKSLESANAKLNNIARAMTLSNSEVNE